MLKKKIPQDRRKWKIKDKQGNRKASTDGNGKILSK